MKKGIKLPHLNQEGFQNLLSLVNVPHLSLNELVSWISSLLMVFGGIVPFALQYQKIKKSENTDGFSTYVCLTLLIANILRIMFWFGHPFEPPLLIQSIVMILTMLELLRLCISVKYMNEITTKRLAFTDFNRQHFWDWNRFYDYLQFLLSFTVVVSLLTYFLLDNAAYVESIGFLAVFTESMLGAPQFYRNYANKSTLGMSVKMVLCWAAGDTFKTAYFILRDAPIQFWICGMMQTTIDIAILCQVYYYGKNKAEP